MEVIESKRIDQEQANKIVSRYVCAQCWGHLRQLNHDRQTRSCVVVCANENCNGTGFVTKYYAERARAKSRSELMDFNHICGDIIGRKKMTKSELEESIKKLYG